MKAHLRLITALYHF